MSLKADFTQGYVRNHWYAVAWSSQINDKPFARRILDEPVVLFREPDGWIGALEDRCPHRLAPLSLGECADGGLRCGYHGMVFNGAGQCIRIPGQDKIPETAVARSYPVIEKYGLVWLWMGSAEPDAERLPRIPNFGNSGWAMLDDGYQYHRANYRIEIENLMDPAHTTFVHKETIGNPLAADVPVEVEKSDYGLRAYRWIENVPPTALDAKSRDFGNSRVDRLIAFHFELPATSFVDICVMKSGEERVDANMNDGVRSLSYKFLTPESPHATHFFWLHLRNFRVGDPEFDGQLRKNLDKTFEEDNVIASAIQLEQEATGLRQRTALAIDRAPIMALRMIDRMIEQERAA